MAEVTSYTAEKILELLRGLVAVEGQQESLAGIIQDVLDTVAAAEAERLRLSQEVLPLLEQELIENDARLKELNETTLPNLQTALEQRDAAIEDLVTITVPALQTELEAAQQTIAASPVVYRQPDAPTNPDIDDRYLILGDTWFDTDDNNKQYLWNGAEWSQFDVDIPDFSLTVRKFQVGTHMIY